MHAKHAVDRRSSLNEDRRKSSVFDIQKAARLYEATPSRSDDAILTFLQAIDSPTSLKVWLLWQHKEYEQLAQCDINPLHYDDRAPWLFRDDYAAVCFLSKADFIPLAVSKYDAAIAKFSKYEDICKQTNRRLLSLHSDPSYKGSNVWLLNATRRKIEKILGDFSPEEWMDSCGWGPGSSTLLRGAHVSAANKFDADNGITSDLYLLVRDWFPVAYPLWWDHLTARAEDPFHREAGNKIVTVPKNSKTDRVIAIEPGINLWFQKGLGAMLRRRLRRWGIDLNDQSLNQQLALKASLIPEWVPGALATIDFSSASDSISIETVRALIPAPWFQLMDATRSHYGTLDNKPLRWQKFSSMGNGFTFELESLIFFAAALSVKELERHDGDVSVYGDDVILPVGCVSTFHSFCTFLGFTVNNEKSFYSSSFRESCGSHYFSGLDVKPIYLKSRLSNIQSVYKLANSVRLYAHRCNSYRSCDARFLNTIARFHRWVPKSLRLKIPAGYGDGGFIGNFDEATPTRAKHGIEGYRVVSVGNTGVTCAFEQPGMMLSRLWAVSRLQTNAMSVVVPPNRRTPLSIRGLVKNADVIEPDLLWSDGGYTLRKKVKTRVVILLVKQWYNLGCWE